MLCDDVRRKPQKLKCAPDPCGPLVSPELRREAERYVKRCPDVEAVFERFIAARENRPDDAVSPRIVRGQHLAAAENEAAGLLP